MQYQGDIGFDPHMPGSLLPVSNFVAQYPFVHCFEDLGTEGTPFSSSGNRKYTKHYYVKVAQRVSPQTACRCPGIPRPYTKFNAYRSNPWEADAQDNFALAVEISAKLIDDKEFSWWVVTVEYSTQMPDGGPVSHLSMRMPNELGGIQNVPWELPARLTWDTEEYQEAVDVDLDDKPYMNAAGTPFIPAATVTRTYRVLTIVRNESINNFESNQKFYDNVVNLYDFRGNEPGYALCKAPRGEEMFFGRTQYVKATYRVIMKRRIRRGDGTYTPGWQPRYLNAGLYQKQSLFNIPVSNKTVPIIMFGRQATQPQLLNAAGTVQTERYARPEPDPGYDVLPFPPAHLVGQLKPVWVDFREYPAVDLRILLRGK